MLGKQRSIAITPATSFVGSDMCAMKQTLMVNGNRIEIDIDPAASIDETARAANATLEAHGVYPQVKALTEAEAADARKEAEERIAAHRAELIKWFCGLRLFDRMDLLDTMGRPRDCDPSTLTLAELETMYGLMQPASYP